MGTKSVAKVRVRADKHLITPEAERRMTADVRDRIIQGFKDAKKHRPLPGGHLASKPMWDVQFVENTASKARMRIRAMIYAHPEYGTRNEQIHYAWGVEYGHDIKPTRVAIPWVPRGKYLFRRHRKGSSPHTIWRPVKKRMHIKGVRVVDKIVSRLGGRYYTTDRDLQVGNMIGRGRGGKAIYTVAKQPKIFITYKRR